MRPVRRFAWQANLVGQLTTYVLVLELLAGPAARDGVGAVAWLRFEEFERL
ncbi:hypothetical protein [Streptomyces sp. NPDC055817]